MGRIKGVYFDEVRQLQSAIVHAVTFGKTLCGKRTNGDQWTHPQGSTGRNITCRACERSLDALRRETVGS